MRSPVTFTMEGDAFKVPFYAPNPLDMFPVTSPWTEKLPTCWQQVVVIGKRHDTTYTTDFCPHQLVADLLQTETCRLCCGLVADLRRGNWYNGFWPLILIKT